MINKNNDKNKNNNDKNKNNFINELRKNNIFNKNFYNNFLLNNNNYVEIDDVIDLFLEEENYKKLDIFYKLMNKYNITFKPNKQPKLGEISLYENNIGNKLMNMGVDDFISNNINNIDIDTFLDKKKLTKIFQQYKNANKPIKNLIEEGIMMSYKPVVTFIAKKYTGHGIAINDLIMNGYLGLLIGIRKFDIKYKVEFITYGIFWIKYYISKIIPEYKGIIKIPYYFLNEKRKCNDLANKILQEDNKKDKIKIKDFNIKNTLLQGGYSLDKKINKDEENGDTFGDFITSEMPAPNELFIKNNLTKVINDIIKFYPKQEREFIQLRYGLNGFKKHNLKDIAKKYGITTERVRQILKRITSHIKKHKKDLLF